MFAAEADFRVRSAVARAIGRANHQYYVALNPDPARSITDAEYDRLFRELQALETQFPSCKRRTSPTQRVGGAALTPFLRYVTRCRCCRSVRRPTPP